MVTRWSSDVTKCPLGAKLPPVEDHCCMHTMLIYIYLFLCSLLVSYTTILTSFHISLVYFLFPLAKDHWQWIQLLFTLILEWQFCWIQSCRFIVIFSQYFDHDISLYFDYHYCYWEIFWKPVYNYFIRFVVGLPFVSSCIQVFSLFFVLQPHYNV